MLGSACRQIRPPEMVGEARVEPGHDERKVTA